MEDVEFQKRCAIKLDYNDKNQLDDYQFPLPKLETDTHYKFPLPILKTETHRESRENNK